MFDYLTSLFALKSIICYSVGIWVGVSTRESIGEWSLIAAIAAYEITRAANEYFHKDSSK